ncbi:MAG: insulinase family protein [bacterium]|nr:insulinase family protein [bacterium]
MSIYCKLSISLLSGLLALGLMAGNGQGKPCDPAGGHIDSVTAAGTDACADLGPARSQSGWWATPSGFAAPAQLLAQSSGSAPTEPAVPAVPVPSKINFSNIQYTRPSTSYSAASSRVVAAAPAVKKYVLPNGMTVLGVEAPDENLIVLDYLVHCGVSQEGSNLQGYNQLILKMLNNRISQDEAGDDVVEITGSLVDDGASQDFSRLSITATPVNAMFMLRRLCKAVANPNFTQAELDKARNQTLNSMGDSNGASGQLYDIFLSAFYRVHPYKRTPGCVPVILNRATPEEVSRYYQRNFTPDRTVLTAAGRMNREKIFDTVKEYCSDMLAAKERLIEVQWEPKAVEREIYLYSQSELAWVLLGYQAPSLQSSDFAAMQVIYGALGAGLSSRLWTQLRENRGLAYEVGARYPELMGPSHLLCHVITKPGSVGVARRRMLAEIDRLKKEGMSELELSETKEKLLGMYLLEREGLSGRALHLGMAELSGAGFESDARRLQELQAVTTDDVKRVASRYLVEPTLIMARPGGRFYLDW